MDPSRIPDLAAVADGDRPVFLFAGDGRLLWVNDAAAVFWGAPSAAGVMASSGRFSAAGEQARDLVRALPTGQSRLERMRIVPFGRTVPLTSQVKRLQWPEGERALLVVGMEGVSQRALARMRAQTAPVPDAEPDVAALQSAEPAEPPSNEAVALAEALATGLAAQPALSEGDSADTPVSMGDALAEALSSTDVAATTSDELTAAADEPPQPLIEPTPWPEPMPDASPSAEPEAAPAPPAEAAADAEPDTAGQARIEALATRTRPLRFTFLTSPGGRLIQISSEFARAVGPDGLPREGETLPAFAARAGMPDFVTMLGQAVPWTGLRLAWPVTGAPERALVDLSGTMMPGGGVRGLGSFVSIVAAPSQTTTEAGPTDDRSPEAADETVSVEAAPEPATTLDSDIAAAQSEDACTPAQVPEPSLATDAVGAEAEPPTTTIDEAQTPAPEAAANVLAFPAQKSGASPERKLDASDHAALRTIARVLGGPIAVPPAPEPPRVPSDPAPVRADPASPDTPALRPAATSGGGAAAMVVPSAFFVPEASEPAVASQPQAAPQVDDERLRALEAELAVARQREAELSGIIDTAIDGVIVLDGAGQIRSLNRSAQALFGLESADVAGQMLTAVLAPESHRTALDYLDGLARNGVASVLNDGREVVGLERKGGRIPLFMTIGRLGGDGAPGFCAVLRDVTQWKRAEQELIAARRQAENASNQKSDFLAKISHEIRTPLNAIIGFSEVMIEERFGRVENDRYRGYLADIRTSGEHLLSLVNDLLDLSKIEAGKLDLSFSAVRLGDLVQQAVATMQPQANREGVILRTSVPNTPPVVADVRSLRQILFNLLSNAIKFTRSGGQVIISTAMTDAGEVQLRVRDTGLGMTEAEIETALEPFRQVATRGRAQSEGTGLGLPLTKALAEANRAAFQIESQPGEGTLVQITFPSTRVLAE